ncbi:MAG: phosphoethanolamine transferase [Rickettsiaceae bacterium]
MFKYIHKHIDANLIKAAFAFALIHCFLFNSSIFVYKLSYIHSSLVVAILEIIKDIIYSIITLFVIFFGLTIHRVVFIVSSIILFVASALASYYLFFFSVSPSGSMMHSVFGTHLNEVYELLSIKLILWLVFSFSICVYSIKYFKIQNTKLFFTKLLASICLLITISNIITPKYSFMKTSFPIQYLHNSYIYFFGASNEYAREELAKKFSFTDVSDGSVIGVFVIGEAARYDHFGINGYQRDTTPNLSKNENVVSYKTASCASFTHVSLPCMLSRYGEKDIDLVQSETGLLSVLTHLGFETIFMGTQSIVKHYKNRSGGTFYDEVKFHMIPGGSIAILPNSHDGNLLPHLEQNIKNNKKQFIVLHTTGSHWNYAARHPEEFAKFTPALQPGIKGDASSYSTMQLVNSYDNSILYTDFFLSSVINNLKDKNAFLIYSSDHGESLGENGRLTHGVDEYVLEQRIVPLIIWFSDSYKSANPKKWASIKSLASKEISHDYLFHTILDCLNIDSDAIDKSLSLCQNY